MKYPEFKLESYLAEREFKAPFNLCASDVESWPLNEVLQLGDQESLDLWKDLKLCYTETWGHPLLREEISKIYGKSREEILCFAGAEEGIYCMAHTLLEAKDHAIVITPCYQSLEALPASICQVTQVPLQKGWELDVGQIEAAIKSNTKLIVVNFPHNPTGTLITHKTQLELVEVARKHDLWIFSDEVYRLLEIDPADRLPPFASIYEKAMSLSVMSKAYGFPGLRIGWIACENKTALRHMNELKHYLSICNSGPSEILSLMALRASEKVLERNRSLMLANLKLLEAFFKEYAEWFEWVKPKGGCIGYPLFKGDVPVDQLADNLLEEFGVLILPGTIYEDPTPHFRIGFGRKSMVQALERFVQFIEKTYGCKAAGGRS